MEITTKYSITAFYLSHNKENYIQLDPGTYPCCLEPYINVYGYEVETREHDSSDEPETFVKIQIHDTKNKRFVYREFPKHFLENSPQAQKRGIEFKK